MNEKEQEIANALLDLILNNPCNESLITNYHGIIKSAQARKEMEAWKPWNPMTGINSAQLATGIRDITPE